MARKRRRVMRRNKGAAKKPATTRKVTKTAKRAATATAKKVAKKTAQQTVAAVVPEIKKVVAQVAKSAAKKAAKAPKARKARVSRTAKRRASLFGRGAPKMPTRAATRGAYVPWDKAPATRTVKYTRKSRPGWHAVGGQWRLFENKRKPRRHRKARRNVGMLPRRGAGGRFLKRGVRKSYRANRKTRVTRRRRRRSTKGMRRNAKGRFLKRTTKRHYRRNRKATRRSGKWSLRKLFGFKRNTGVASTVMGAADVAVGILKPAIATAAGFFLSRIAGTYVRNVTSTRSPMIRTVAPLGAHVGAALLAYYLPRKVGALGALKPYADPAAIGAMMGLVETLLVQFGGPTVREHIAPPSLGDSLDVYERALRGVGDGWNDYNPSDDYLLATLADSDGIGEYIPEPLGEYIPEPLGSLGEYIPEPGADSSAMFEASSGIDTGIYGPGVGDLGVEVEEAVAGVPIEAEEGLANHIFGGGVSGNGLFGLGADSLTAPKVASKAKVLTIRNLKLGMGPTDAGKNAYESLKAAEGVTVGSAAFRAAVVAGVREALESCGCCKPRNATIPRATARRPVAPMVTGKQQCREVCSTGPTVKPGLRLIGGAPQLTQPIGSGGVSDDLGDDMAGSGNFGSMF